MKRTLKMAQLALAGAIVGVAVANIFAHVFGISGGPHQEVGAVVGGALTAAFIKVAHLV